MKKLTTLTIFLLVITLFLAGCNLDTTIIEPSSSTPVTENTQDSVKIVDNTQNVETKQVKSLEVTINSATKENEIADYYYLEDGYIYLVIDCTIKNIAQEEYEFNPYNTMITDNKGYKYEIDLSTYSLKQYFSADKILSERIASGKLVYQVPKGAEGFSFVITDYLGNILSETKLE